MKTDLDTESLVELVVKDMNPEWKKELNEEFSKKYFLQLQDFLKVEINSGYKIYPPSGKIFSAFEYTPFSKVKVVIIGQDPYHGEGQANGLCFSVADGMRRPPSLLNIFKEIESDLGFPIPKSGNLESWTHQGVLLLNSTLTVRAETPGSHQKKGWEQFTDAVIRHISLNSKGVIFLLWGKYAQAKAEMIDLKKHFILTAAHPSPLARTGFKGCRHFSKANELLISIGKKPINWQTEN